MELNPWEIYCPICGRILTASNLNEVDNKEHGGYLFVHDELVHTDCDIEALERGIN